MAKTVGEGSGGNPFRGARARASASVRGVPKSRNNGLGPPLVDSNRRTPKYGIPKGNIVQRKWPKR
jgi:hypothetical protein